jgi:hypothetical protein
LLSALVAVTPCHRSFLLGRPPRLGPGPRWGVRLVAAQVSVVYLASALGKLFDPAWRDGTVLLLRFGVGRAYLASHAPAFDLELLSAPWFAQVASFGAISSELFLALGLWFSRTRPLALWLGVVFHLGIELVAHVELFSYTMLAGYLAFVRPELRERSLFWDATRPLGRRLAALFARLDVLARFEQEPTQAPAGAAATHQELLVIRDREGHAHRGLAAWRELARAMPPLFPLWLPLALVTFRRRPEAAAR